MLAKDKKLKITGSIALLMATLMWGSSFFILKNTIDKLPLLFVLAVRFSIGAFIMGTVCFKYVVKTDKKTFFRGIILGLILSSGYILQTFGLEHTTPATNAFLTAAYCVMVPFIGWLIFKKKPTAFNVIAAIVCLLGIGLISLKGSFRIGIGDALTLISAIFYALQIIYNAFFIKESDFRQLLFLELLTVAVICWIFSLSTENIPTSLSGAQWVSIIYLGIMGSCAAQFLQIFGQKYTPANNASIILSLEAVFGALFSVLFYHERPSGQMIAGFIVVFIAVIISEVGYDLIRSIKEKNIRKKENKGNG